MRAILEFNLDDQWDDLAYKRACNATKAYLALYEISKWVNGREPWTTFEQRIIEIINEYVDLGDLP